MLPPTMARLHLLGFTQDLKGVVFTQRKGAKKAAHWVPIDETFLFAIERLERARRDRDADAGHETDELEEPEPKPKVVLPAIGRSEASGRIPVSEIQQLLREGRTVESVIQGVKASRAWVERLAEPVRVERLGVVKLAQAAFMPRPRLGPSGLPLDQAIRRNLEERRATLGTLETIDEGWDARVMRSGPWRIRLRFNHRGSRRVAEWDFVKSTRQISPRNRLASELGWWPAPDVEPRRVEAALAEIEEDEPETDEEPRARRKKRRKVTPRRTAKSSAKKKAARKKPSKKPVRRATARKKSRR